MDRKAAYTRVGEDLLRIFVIVGVVILIGACVYDFTVQIKYSDVCEEYDYDVASYNFTEWLVQCEKEIVTPLEELREDDTLP